MFRYHYLVSLSEGPALNMTTAKQFTAEGPPFIFNDVQNGNMYSCAVQLVTSDGYKSLPSEVSSIAVSKGNLKNKPRSLVGRRKVKGFFE